MSLLVLIMYLTFLEERRPMHWSLPIASMAFDLGLILILRTT